MQNLLKNEKSLYLKQHQDNPVAWQPYSPETIERSKKENKPLFISIGYSSCHWCHVMAHESFEDEATAKIINDNFIPVKIDREEFPAVDKMYQFYLHATGKKGGWPLSVFALPDERPFFGGTYFPPEPRHSLPAFRDILRQLSNLYKNTPSEAKKFADNYDRFFEKFTSTEHTAADLKAMLSRDVLNTFKKTFDIEHGGLGRDAKFPNIPVLSAMLDYYNDSDISSFLKHTADKMCTSGLFDHVNGGFYRYTVDRQWRVPHFEKMLYDNAQNASFLLEMFDRTDNLLYLKIAEKTIDFIINEFSTDFGMITAMDADSPDEQGKTVEGYYYLITEDPSDDRIVIHEGVINLKSTDYESYISLEPLFEKIRVSNTRIKPVKDEKVILSLNMLFCSTLLKMFEMSGKEFYREQATALFNKVKHFLMDGSRLFRINYQGDVFGNTTLEDYAYTIKTHIDFFEITKERPFLSTASELMQEAIYLFYDNGVFYLDSDRKVVDTFDDSTPNPSGMAVKIIEDYGDVMGVSKETAMTDFASDRFIKYTAGHPTLLTALKGYLK